MFVRNSIATKRWDYARQPEEVFNTFIEAARREIEFPPLWPTFYLKEGEEKVELSEQTTKSRP